MRHELASVYLRLKQLDKAEKTVMKGLQQTTGDACSGCVLKYSVTSSHVSVHASIP